MGGRRHKSGRRRKTIDFHVTVEGMAMDVFVDTSADVNVISRKLATDKKETFFGSNRD